MNIKLMSRKPTDALYVGLNLIPDGLALGSFARTLHGSSVRAAAISATYLIVQKAALELDVDPDEFEVLEPRKREGKPLLQFADTLVNGAGFSRRLGEMVRSRRPLVADLISSMLNPGDEFTDSFFQAKHADECVQSCYICLQRYGNRQYHGLWDWRLGLGFLRGMVDDGFRCGLDGKWNSYRETSDWPRLASRIRDELCRLSPDRRKPKEFGDQGLPGLVEEAQGQSTSYVMVHPLWSTDPQSLWTRFFKSVAKSAGGRMPYFIDTFDANRRPVAALRNSRERPIER